jgi:hypothetical protein
MARESTPSKPWYGNGLQFECTQCGNCCSGPSGPVWIKEDEATVLARALGLPLADFRKRYARPIGKLWSLREVPAPQVTQASQSYDCVFLDRSDGTGRATCRVYQHRPSQCRSWPFWSPNLADRDTWDAVKKNTPCPGMSQGRPYSPAEVEHLRHLWDVPVDRERNP